MTKKLQIPLLLEAYAHGYFPMPNSKTEEIEWYFPDPRAVIPLDGFKASRSLLRTIKKSQYTYTLDTAFVEVMKGCANRKETWINPEFFRVYLDLYRLGYAHSVEVWCEKKIVGGVYGVSIGGAFFAESKFHTKTDASKAALYFLVNHLKEKKFSLLEVQFLTPHLESLGAIEIPASDYQKILLRAIHHPAQF